MIDDLLDNMKDLAQFKLTNGSEIVCEIMEWPENEGEEIIARNAMSIVPYELEGAIVYGFKPWIHYLESSNEYLTINPNHIVASNRPNKHLAISYHESVNDMNKHSKMREAEFQREQAEKLKVLADAITKITEEKAAKSKESKVIVFPGKNDSVH